MIFVEYNTTYIDLLEKYFKHPLTPVNNASHKIFKTHLFNGIDGILGMLIDNNEIVAVSSAIIVTENSIKSCKYPHRLHVRSDYTWYSNKFVDKHWDILLFNWLKEKNINNVYCTFNETNHSAFLWAALRHARRRNHNTHINDFGKTILNQNWYVYPKIVTEMNTWQYLIYSSLNDKWFYNHKDEKDMSDELIKNLDSRFNFVSGSGWKI
jgi:hypothetical protein